MVAWGINASGQTNVPADVNTSLPVTVSGTVTTNLPGTYVLTYKTANAFGAVASLTRTVTVPPLVAAVVTLNGPATVTNECHSPYADAAAFSGASALAGGASYSLALRSDGTVAAWGYNGYGQTRIPASVYLPATVSGSVDTNAPGSYMLTYNATNFLGISGSVTRTVVVRDTLPPVITLLGASPLTTLLNAPFLDPGATALDVCGGSLAITTNSTVNVAQPGTYAVTYRSTDSSGNSATNTRTVVVVPNAPAVTTLAATSITATNATLNGTVNPDGAATTAYFQYGLTTSYGSFSSTNSLAATNAVLNVSNLLSGLAPGTIYHYRLVAANSAGTNYGSDITLTTVSDTRFVNPNNPTPASPYSSWATAATNIQDAINAAVAGNTVLVTNGIYGVGTTQDNLAYFNRVLINKAITVRSVNGPAFTMISGGPSTRCVWMTNGAVLAGFTLTNGNVISYGGGVYAASSQEVISHCWITGSRGNNAGGVYQGTLYDCTLTNNYTTGDGGGAYSSTLYRCTLIGNTSDGFGGGLSYGILSSCLLISNKASSRILVARFGGAWHRRQTSQPVLTGAKPLWQWSQTHNSAPRCTFPAGTRIHPGRLTPLVAGSMIFPSKSCLFRLLPTKVPEYPFL